MDNLREYLDYFSQKYPKKLLYCDKDNEFTYAQFLQYAKRLASFFCERNYFRKPIAILDNRDVNTLIVMFACFYSGNYYIILDAKAPCERIAKIFDCCRPIAIVGDDCSKQHFCEVFDDIDFFDIKELKEYAINESNLQACKEKIVSTDIAYILFTSGSTGVPKGVVINHQSLINYLKWFVNTFDINEEIIFGGQFSFSFSASVSDLFGCVMAGATYYIIPKTYFSFPMRLLTMLNEKKVNTIYWVPSALCILANLKVFDYLKPQYLQKVLFVGEPMPNKQLNYWRKQLNNCMYANLFGPTETVDICCYYKLDREFQDDEPLPIGKHCENIDTFILDSNNKQIVEKNKIGQLCVRGGFLALGYFNNKKQTEEVFVQNPLNNSYPEIIYKTGDLVKINERGEYIYVGRIDSQIKHMGYRIELGEIEVVVLSVASIDSAVCIFDKSEDKIVLIFCGNICKQDLLKCLESKLCEYMLPNVLIKMKEMPINSNGKIDRKYLTNNYRELIETK